MSNLMKFSDLKSDDPIININNNNNDDPYNSTINGFSTIDLNNQLNSDDSSVIGTNNLTASSISSGYTSFDQPFNSKQVNNSNTNTNNFSPKHNNKNPMTTTNSIDLAQAGTKLAAKTVNTFENIKQWSKSAYKCTKQIISEKLGKTSRTIDPELEADILKLRETKKKYEYMLNLSRSMYNHFYNFINTQKSMAELFSELSQKTPELIEEFSKNSETQRAIFKNGEALLCALELFNSNLNTLCNKTIEDTLITIRNYEAARLEYDAYRYDLELMQNSSSGSGSFKIFNNQQQHINQTQRTIETKQNQLNEIEKQYKIYKERYEKLRDDVTIKIKFLDENKLKVMQKQLVLFNSATSAYFSGNQKALESTLKEFSIKLTQPKSNNEFKESFLEK